MPPKLKPFNQLSLEEIAALPYYDVLSYCEELAKARGVPDPGPEPPVEDFAQYNKWVRAVQEYDRATENIRKRFARAVGIVYTRKENQRKFNKILEILDGDGAKAWKVFRAACLDIPDFIPEGAVVEES